LSSLVGGGRGFADGVREEEGRLRDLMEEAALPAVEVPCRSVGIGGAASVTSQLH
jgi:hypothetical protein